MQITQKLTEHVEFLNLNATMEKSFACRGIMLSLAGVSKMNDLIEFQAATILVNISNCLNSNIHFRVSRN